MSSKRGCRECPSRANSSSRSQGPPPARGRGSGAGCGTRCPSNRAAGPPMTPQYFPTTPGEEPQWPQMRRSFPREVQQHQYDGNFFDQNRPGMQSRNLVTGLGSSMRVQRHSQPRMPIEQPIAEYPPSSLPRPCPGMTLGRRSQEVMSDRPSAIPQRIQTPRPVPQAIGGAIRRVPGVALRIPSRTPETPPIERSRPRRQRPPSALPPQPVAGPQVSRTQAARPQVCGSQVVQQPAARSQAARQQAAQAQAARQQAAQAQAARPRSARSQSAGSQAARQQAAQAQAARQQAAQAQAARQQAAQARAARPRSARSQSAGSQAARQQVARRQVAQSQAARSQAARPQAAQPRAAGPPCACGPTSPLNNSLEEFETYERLFLQEERLGVGSRWADRATGRPGYDDSSLEEFENLEDTYRRSVLEDLRADNVRILGVNPTCDPRVPNAVHLDVVPLDQPSGHPSNIREVLNRQWQRARADWSPEVVSPEQVFPSNILDRGFIEDETIDFPPSPDLNTGFIEDDTMNIPPENLNYGFIDDETIDFPPSPGLNDGFLSDESYDTCAQSCPGSPKRR